MNTQKNPSEAVWAYLIAATAGAAGLASLSLFGIFLWTGGLRVIDLNIGWRSALAWDAALCVMFAVQHSVMVRRPFRAWLSGVIPAYWHGAVYTIASGAALVLLSTCWQPSQLNIYILEGAGRWTLRALLVSSLAGVLWGICSLGQFDAFGIDALLSHVKRRHLRAPSLIIRGPYRWVRHPLYFCGLVALWACPSMSADRLLANILLTSWIVVGTVLEEHDLVADFGDAYRRYRREVPMLVPWRRALPFRQVRPAATLVGP